MARYASGKNSKAICDISGFELSYKDLRTTWKGLRVSPEEFDIKQPQLMLNQLFLKLDIIIIYF